MTDMGLPKLSWATPTRQTDTVVTHTALLPEPPITARRQKPTFVL